MIWLRQQKLAWASSLKRLFAQPLATLLTTLALGVAISLPVGLYLALATFDRLAAKLPAQPELSVYLDDDASLTQRKQLEAGIRAQPEVNEARYISRDDALASLQGQGLATLTAGLDHNPLPDAWVVRTHDAAQLAGLQEAFSKFPGVADVQLDSQWVARIAAARVFGQTLVVLAALLFGVALIAISANAIRAQVLARRDEILVSRLIGASTRYIRRPFVYAGTLQGLFGGFAAWVLLWLAASVLGDPLADLARLYAADWSLYRPALEEVVTVLVATAALGGLGAWVAVGRTLRQVEAST